MVVQSLSHVWLFAAPVDCSMPDLHYFPELAQSDWSPLSWWCHPAISSSAAPFSFCLQSFPASGSFPVSHLSISGGQSIGASASVPPMNIQSWFPMGLIGLISLQSRGLSRVFFSTIVWKHQFFGAQPFFMVQLSHPYMTIGKTMAWLYGP